MHKRSVYLLFFDCRSGSCDKHFINFLVCAEGDGEMHAFVRKRSSIKLYLVVIKVPQEASPRPHKSVSFCFDTLTSLLLSCRDIARPARISAVINQRSEKCCVRFTRSLTCNYKECTTMRGCIEEKGAAAKRVWDPKLLLPLH